MLIIAHFRVTLENTVRTSEPRVTSTDKRCHGSMFSSQHLHNDSRLPVTLVPGNPAPSSGLCRSLHLCGANKLVQMNTHRNNFLKETDSQIVVKGLTQSRTRQREDEKVRYKDVWRRATPLESICCGAMQMVSALAGEDSAVGVCSPAPLATVLAPTQKHLPSNCSCAAQPGRSRHLASSSQDNTGPPKTKSTAW